MFKEQWVKIPVGDTMEKVNPVFFYHLGGLLKPLTEMQPDKAKRVDIWLASTDVWGTVKALLDYYDALRTCRRTGYDLMNSAYEVGEWMRNTPYEEWGKDDSSVDVMFRRLLDKAKEFQILLQSELQEIEMYHVSPKGIYSTTSLIAETEKMFPASVLAKLNPLVIEEIRQSGRCFAFDIPTAAGFHILRATEAVMCEYYLAVCQPCKTEELENWGAYIAELYKIKEPDVKETVALLQQIKDNDRNLIFHPERILSPDDAFTLFEIAKGAIMAMAVRLLGVGTDSGKRKRPRKKKT